MVKVEEGACWVIINLTHPPETAAPPSASANPDVLSLEQRIQLLDEAGLNSLLPDVRPAHACAVPPSGACS